VAPKESRVVFVGQDDCRIENFSIPETLAPDQVLVRNAASLVSAGTELAILRKTHRGFAMSPVASWIDHPHYPGYANVGRVIATGERVTAVTTGDLVWHPSPHATVSVLPGINCLIVPAGVSPEDAVFFALAQVAMTSIRRAPCLMGETVLVSGAGLVGMLCAQLYRLAGARVTIADPSAGRLNRARDAGLHEAIDLTATTLEARYADHPDQKPTLVVEAAGVEASIASCLKVAATGGRVVLLGSPRNLMEIDPYTDIMLKGLTIIGAHAMSVEKAVREMDVDYLFQLCGGALRLDAIRTHVLPYTDAPALYDKLESHLDEYLGVVLTY
jgi:2-desacetyl-2-hydroxyethyl bacteriochlorophyllide A dehydrogenase